MEEKKNLSPRPNKGDKIKIIEAQAQPALKNKVFEVKDTFDDPWGGFTVAGTWGCTHLYSVTDKFKIEK